MVSMAQVWVGVGAPAQDLVVEGPYSLCSFRALFGVQWRALENPVEVRVYMGGERHDSK
jgi:hypothetical protein